MCAGDHVQDKAEVPRTSTEPESVQSASKLWEDYPALFPPACNPGGHGITIQDAEVEVKGLAVGLGLFDQLEPCAWSYPWVSDDEIIDGGNSVNLNSEAEPKFQSPFFFEGHDTPEDEVWRDLTNKYIHLYGQAPDLPNFKLFLKNLRPSTSGLIECPSCRNYTHGEFDPYAFDIRYHFRHFHLDQDKSIKNADDKGFPMLQEALHRLLDSNSNRELVDTLLKDCGKIRDSYQKARDKAADAAAKKIARQKAKLPSITMFLDCLRVTPCGQLTCRDHASWGLGDLSRSNNSTPLDSLKTHFFEDHCSDSQRSVAKQTQANIDNAMTFPWVADHIQWLIKKSSVRSKRWALMADEERSAALSLESTKNLEMHFGIRKKHLKRMPQWKIFGALTKAFCKEHERLRELPLNVASVRLFINHNRDARKALRCGVDTFRQVLRGQEPTTLREVYAFANLAYAMNNVMQARGLPVELAPSIHDFFSWRAHIVDPDEKSVFDHMVICLFLPDGISGLKYNPAIPTIPSLLLTFTSLLAPTPMNELQMIWASIAMERVFLKEKPNSMKDLVLSLMNGKSLDEEFSFSAFFHLNPHPQSSSDIDVAQQCQGEASQAPGRTCRNHDGLPPEDPGGTPPGSSTSMPVPIPLVETAIFFAALRFMVFLGSFGVLFIYLGNPDRPSYCHVLHREGKKWEVRSLIETVEAMKTKVTDPIMCDERFKSMGALFQAVEEVLDLGCIRSFVELSEVMIALAARTVSDLTLCSSLLSEIKKRCADAEASIASPGPGQKRSAEMMSSDSDAGPSRKHVYNGGDSGNAPGTGDVLSSDGSAPERTSDPAAVTQSRTCHCGKEYTGPSCLSNLRRHQREVHSGWSWKCDHCGTLAERKSNLQDHLRRRHERLSQNAFSKVRTELKG